MRTDGRDGGTVDPAAIDWEALEAEGRSYTRRDLAAGLSIVGYLLAWLGDHTVGIDVGPELTNVDWLFGLVLLVGCWTVVVPLWRDERVRRYYWRRIRLHRAAMVSLVFLGVVFLVGLLGPMVLGRPEPNWALGHLPPVGFGGTWDHPLGTTRNGEDVLLIAISGMQVSMQVGLIATAVSVALATVVGTTAAVAGGWVDEALMRGVDLLMTFPTFFLILFLVFVYGGDLFLLIVILSITGWGGQARLIRSEALQRVEEGYVRAARAAGASRRYVVRHHVLPNVSNTVITAATLAIPYLILYEAVVAFLGFGDPDVWSWGRAIDDGRSHLGTAPWVSTIPGVFLFLTVLAFNFLGDALRDALDPRHQP